MALITFLSDFGTQDHYVSVVRASIWKLNPTLRVSDISHDIPCADLLHGAFVLASSFGAYPAGTIHLVSVGADTCEGQNGIIVQLEGQLFVGANNGLFSLISDKKPDFILDLSAIPHASGTFAAYHRYAPAAAMLASGQSPYELGQPVEKMKELIQPQFRPTQDLMRGHIIHIDAQGNLISSIKRAQFEEWRKSQPQFEILLGNERFQIIHTHYHEVAEGEPFCLFNQLDWLEIGIRYGNAHQLLGLGFRAPIRIQAIQASPLSPPEEREPV